jgi:hypothetical protein
VCQEIEGGLSGGEEKEGEGDFSGRAEDGKVEGMWKKVGCREAKSTAREDGGEKEGGPEKTWAPERWCREDEEHLNSKARIAKECHCVWCHLRSTFLSCGIDFEALRWSLPVRLHAAYKA